MPQARPFSKLKKQIENLFAPELNMQVYCIAFPVRSQYGSSNIPRYYVKLGKEIIWDFPKDFPLKEISFHLWNAKAVDISDLIRTYIDTPLDELLSKSFETEEFHFDEENIHFNLGLTNLFIAADRRIGKEKLQKKFVDVTNKGIEKVLEKRFNK